MPLFHKINGRRSSVTLSCHRDIDTPVKGWVTSEHKPLAQSITTTLRKHVGKAHRDVYVAVQLVLE